MKKRVKITRKATYYDLPMFYSFIGIIIFLALTAVPLLIYDIAIRGKIEILTFVYFIIGAGCSIYFLINLSKGRRPWKTRIEEQILEDSGERTQDTDTDIPIYIGINPATDIIKSISDDVDMDD